MNNHRPELKNLSEFLIKSMPLFSITQIYPRSDLTADQISYLNQFCNGADRDELPLHLALFLSPLYLLLPKSLHKMKGRIDIFDVMEVRFRQRPFGVHLILGFITRQGRR